VAQASLATAEEFVDAINRHDLDALCALMSEEHGFIDSLGAVFQGREALRTGWGSYFRTVPDYCVAVPTTSPSGGCSARRATASARCALERISTLSRSILRRRVRI